MKNKKYLENIIKVTNFKYKVDFILRNGDRLPLILCINKNRFPFELPEVFIDISKQKYIPSIPHVTSNGYICYLDKEGVAWSDDPIKVFDFVFERIDSVLFKNESVEGIHREFQYYFAQVSNIDYAVSCIKQGNQTRKVKIYNEKKKGIGIIWDSVSQRNESKIDKFDNPQVSNAIYIPFYKQLDLYVPNKSKFWTGEEIRDLVERCVTKENIELIKELTKHNILNYYVLDILLASNQHVLVGLMYRNKGKESFIKKNCIPILDCSIEMEIKPICIQRIDDTKTLIRGGAITNGNEFKILVIGCGSVGSDLIFQLARSGFKNITLIDYDKMNEDNIYRHFLGKSRNKKERYKTTLLKEEITGRYDDMNIIEYKEDIFSLLEKKQVVLEGYSLVISAIGDINKERLLNKYIVKGKTPIIYTWVEAYGLGGHAVLTNNGSKGCFNCLITDDLMCKVNFAGKSEKPFVRNFGGCLGTFTPYGGIDAMQTAILSARLAEECLLKNIKGNKVMSWKGDAEFFLNNGYKLNTNYSNFTLGIGERDDIEFKGCAYCNDKV